MFFNLQTLIRMPEYIYLMMCLWFDIFMLDIFMQYAPLKIHNATVYMP